MNNLMYYFAYSHYLNKTNMQQDCPGSVPKFTAVLPNFKLVFTGWSRKWRSGTASVIRFSGGKVPGSLYEVSEDCLRRLDRHEVGYSRLKVIVFDEDGTAIEAITYINAGQLEECLPSKEYAEVLRQGYREWGIG